MPRRRIFHLGTDFNGRPPKPFRRPNGYFYIRLTIHGKKIWRSLCTKDRKEADKLGYRIWLEYQNPAVQHMLGGIATTLDTVFKLYSKTEKYSNLVPSSQKEAGQLWARFCRHLEECKVDCLQDITRQHCESYLSNLKKAKSYNTTRSFLESIVTPACKESNIENPLKDIERKSTTKGDNASVPYRALSRDEIQRLFEALESSTHKDRGEYLDVAKTALLTGLRLKDVCLLHSSQIKDNCLEIIPSKTAKFGKAVLIRISPPLQKILEGKTGDIFPSVAREYRRSHKSVASYYSRLFDLADLKDDSKGKASFHSIRVTVATEAARHGIDLDKLGGVLGHSSERQTEHYDKSSKDISLDFLGSLLSSKM